MEFKGRIERVFPVQTGTGKSGNQWRKQDFVFEYFEHETDRWSDKVLLSALNERVDAYDLHVGDEVIIGFGHGVDDYNGRLFNRIRVYKFEKTKSVVPEVKQEEKPAEQPVETKTEVKPEEGEKDLPF